MKDGMVEVTPLLQRSLQCPYCPMKCALKKHLTMHLQARHGQPKREAKHNSLKVECSESVAHLECPSLRELRNKHGLETRKDAEVFVGAQLASFLKELFKLENPSAHAPDEQQSKPVQGVEKHRFATERDATYSPSLAEKRIGACTARGMRKRSRESDLLTKAICSNVSVCEARVGTRFRLTSPCGLQNRSSIRKSSATQTEYKHNKQKEMLLSWIVLLLFATSTL
ncbi:hypothetical protein TRVL_08998 [Trypanosoma vivax]|nr:hypothetical protein TRVL_08998 [Trypanosoma vivax]